MRTNIRKFREEMGLTQQELANIVDVTRQTIIALERGKYNPSLILAYKITLALKKKYIEEVFEIEN
ncbi:MAG: helix-turn-helix transcriptional regulator [Methanobacteriaceae archaeon]|jgi:putative transcriptional regulator|nr:MAG: transcriptional regulator [Methanobacterium sp. BRmetb2]MCC7557647.1 helix-turn-helix transcriptional regulator [Methanobacteriaceae archaeon]